MSERPAPPRPPVVCRLLRTKSGFGSLDDGEAWKRGDSTTDVFWCLNTMEPVGPDDQYVHPHGCCSGRICFQVPANTPDHEVA